MNPSKALPGARENTVAAPRWNALRALAFGNGVILVAIAWALDVWVLPPVYESLLHAEVEAFAIGYVLFFYITPVALIAGSVLGVWLARRLQHHATPRTLFVRVWAVQLVIWLVVLIVSFPAEIGGALKSA
jgi:hypothetical protein